MAIIDLTSGSGIRSSAMVSAARRILVAGSLPMTVTPVLTTATLSAELARQISVLQIALSAIPADVWKSAITSNPQPGSAAAVVSEAAARIAASL